MATSGVFYVGPRRCWYGGRGFLGRHIVELLRREGADPVPVGRNEADLVDLDETLDLFRSLGRPLWSTVR